MVARKNWLAVALLALTAILVMGVAVPAALAQETDGRINVGVYMGGANVYCVNVLGGAAASYANGGGILVLDAHGEKLLFVSEAEIEAGFAQVAATGEYATLGMSDRLWYGDAPVALYLLASEEFQLNIYDEYEKLVELRWTECGLEAAAPPQIINQGTANCGPGCRDWSRGTNDGCLPGWDWHKEEARCVHANFD